MAESVKTVQGTKYIVESYDLILVYHRSAILAATPIGQRYMGGIKGLLSYVVI